MATQPSDLAARYTLEDDKADQETFLQSVDTSPVYYDQVRTLQQTSEQVEPLLYVRNPAVRYCPAKDQWLNGAADDPVTADALHRIEHLELAVFFDGTANNLRRQGANGIVPGKVDGPTGKAADKMTNVGRLFGLYREEVFDEGRGLRRALYIRGVGSIDQTAIDEAQSVVEQKRKDALAAKVKEAEDQRAKGVAGVQAAAQAPSSWWDDASRFLDKVEELAKAGARKTAELPGNLYRGGMKGGANTFGGIVGTGARNRLLLADVWIMQQVKALPNLRDVKVDTFGFSRGAATARSFVNGYEAWTAPKIRELRGYKGEKITASMRFAGLFDTVGTFDLLGAEKVGEHNLAVGRYWKAAGYTHICAEDEFRANFELSPIDNNDVILPGCHSDVGGGYGRIEQGKSDALARISMARMWKDADAAGVPLNPYPDRGAAAIMYSLDKYRKVRTDVWAAAMFAERDCDDPMLTPDQVEQWRKQYFYETGKWGRDACAAAVAAVLPIFNTYIHLSHVFAKGSNVVGDWLVSRFNDPAPEFARKRRLVVDREPGNAPFTWRDLGTAEAERRHLAQMVSSRGRY